MKVLMECMTNELTNGALCSVSKLVFHATTTKNLFLTGFEAGQRPDFIAEFTWNDLGSWASLYEYQIETRLRGDSEGNVADTGGLMALDAANNYVFSPRKFVALVGVKNLVIVDTEDALLIAHRDHSQDVGKIVKELGNSGRDELI